MASIEEINNLELGTQVYVEGCIGDEFYLAGKVERLDEKPYGYWVPLVCDPNDGWLKPRPYKENLSNIIVRKT